MTKRWILAGFLAMLVAVASVGGVAQADGPDSTEPSDKPETSEYTLPGISGMIGGLLFSSGSPSNCRQSAKEPRKSGSKVQGEIRATCDNVVPRIKHEAELLRWQGWTGGGWRAIGKKGKFDRRQVKSGAAYGTTSCTDHKFKVTGEGYVIDTDNVKYLTGTTSRIKNNPCNL